MSIPFKSDTEKLDKVKHFSGNLFDLLPEDHDCFVFKDLFEQLDTAEIEASSRRKGQNAYHPRKIVGILIYGLTSGVFSSRQLERRCLEDLSFMYIAFITCPNFRVLSDFRFEHPEFFHECFKQTVGLALEMGLASLGHVSFDGSKIKANSSKHKAICSKHLKEKEQKLCKEWRGALGCKIGIHAYFAPGPATPPIKCAKASPVSTFLRKLRNRSPHDFCIGKSFCLRQKGPSYLGLLAFPWLAAEEIEELVEQANASDIEEDTEYHEKTSYELPEEIKFKKQRLETIKTAKEALEAREEALNPGKPIDDKKQISFADTDARIMGKKGHFDYNYNPQIELRQRQSNHNWSTC